MCVLPNLVRGWPAWSSLLAHYGPALLCWAKRYGQALYDGQTVARLYMIARRWPGFLHVFCQIYFIKLIKYISPIFFT